MSGSESDNNVMKLNRSQSKEVCSDECFSQNMHNNNLVCMLGEEVQGFIVGPYHLIYAEEAGNFVSQTSYLNWHFLPLFLSQVVDRP